MAPTPNTGPTRPKRAPHPSQKKRQNEESQLPTPATQITRKKRRIKALNVCRGPPPPLPPLPSSPLLPSSPPLFPSSDDSQDLNIGCQQTQKELEVAYDTIPPFHPSQARLEDDWRPRSSEEEGSGGSEGGEEDGGGYEGGEEEEEDETPSQVNHRPRQRSQPAIPRSQWGLFHPPPPSEPPEVTARRVGARIQRSQREVRPASSDSSGLEASPTEFEYESQWTVYKQKVGGEELANRAVDGLKSEDGARGVYESFRTWLRDFEDSNRELKTVVKTLVVRHRRIKTLKDAVRSDLNREEDWLHALERVKRGWLKNNESNFRLDVFVVVKPEAPTQRARQPRGSTTDHMLGQLRELRGNDGVVGNDRVRIIERWKCGNSRCHNAYGVCWVDGADKADASNHFPIASKAYELWMDSIAAGASTVDQPALEVKRLLQELKLKGRTQHNMEGLKSRGASHSVHIYQTFNTGSGASNQSTVRVNSPSQSLGEPPSSLVDHTQRVKTFFRWLKQHPAFINKREDWLNIRHVVVDEKDFSLRQAKDMSLDSWLRCQLKEGQHQRFRGCISRFEDSEETIKEEMQFWLATDYEGSE